MTSPSTAIILLGSTNDDRGVLSSVARERCDQAIVEFRRRSGSLILPTGAFGSHFNTTKTPHGEYLRDYLLAQGIPDAAVLAHVESSNTIEDAKFSRPIVERHGFRQLVVVTSDFHLERARFLFTREYPGRPLEFSASATNLAADELEKKVAHERGALARLRSRAGEKG